MTYKLKLMVGTLLWVVYGGVIWGIASMTDTRKAVFVLGVISSATYLVLLSVLFFIPKRRL